MRWFFYYVLSIRFIGCSNDWSRIFTAISINNFPHIPWSKLLLFSTIKNNCCNFLCLYYHLYFDNYCNFLFVFFNVSYMLLLYGMIHINSILEILLIRYNKRNSNLETMFIENIISSNTMITIKHKIDAKYCDVNRWFMGMECLVRLI